MVDWCIISHHIACYLTSNNIMLYHIISHHIILYLCACLSVCLCACLSVCLSICLSVYFSVSRSICLRVSVCLCAYLSIYLYFSSLSISPLTLCTYLERLEVYGSTVSIWLINRIKMIILIAGKWKETKREEMKNKRTKI